MRIHRRDRNDILDIVSGLAVLFDSLDSFDILRSEQGGHMAAENLQDRLPTVERSVARLEGAYEHVATKADVADVKTDIAAINAKLQLLQWITGIGFTVIAGLLIHMLGIIAS